MFFQNNKKRIETEIKVKNLEESIPALSRRLQKIESAHTVVSGKHAILEEQFGALITSVNKLNETSDTNNKTLIRLDENMLHNNTSLKKIDDFITKTQSAGWKIVTKSIAALLIGVGSFVVGCLANNLIRTFLN